MKYKTLLYEKKDTVAIITFNNPKKMNPLSPEFLVEYKDLLGIIEEDPEIGAVILTGAGKAFIAGADIPYMSSMMPEEATRYAANTTVAYQMMEQSRKIFIAAINGYALGGGCEMSLACDLRIASAKAKIGCTEVSLGIIPGGGGTQRLPRLIGPGSAKRLIYTARVLSSYEALKIGLVDEVADPDSLMGRALEIAAEIGHNSRAAVGVAKEAINRGMQMDLDSGVNLEKNLFALCFDTHDQKEGMAAFQEKRPARFA